MSPAQEDNERARQWRINAWLHRRAPEGNPFPGDPRNWEREHGTTAALTPLGRKLLGLDLWNEEAEDGGKGGQIQLDQGAGRGRGTPGFSS